MIFVHHRSNFVNSSTYDVRKIQLEEHRNLFRLHDLPLSFASISIFYLFSILFKVGEILVNVPFTSFLQYFQRRIQNPVKYLRRTFLQKQVIVFSRYFCKKLHFSFSNASCLLFLLKCKVQNDCKMTDMKLCCRKMHLEVHFTKLQNHIIFKSTFFSMSVYFNSNCIERIFFSWLFQVPCY